MRKEHGEVKRITIRILWVSALLLLLGFGCAWILPYLGMSTGASFGAGLGGSKQRPDNFRQMETDAPIQTIYSIDDHRYLTLENYLTCDLGGQVYYNDTRKGIKTLLGYGDEKIQKGENYYGRANDIAAYRGVIINIADNGWLAGFR